MEPSNQNLTQIHFFYEHSLTLYDVMQQEIENLDLFKG